ncbi:MAG: AAA family ATPase [Chloroflexota bacterium]|nr:AAA family ATPase [Chloroflexota bacterium]
MVAPSRPRADLPEGSVTLLFTDIEGSTQLLRQLGPLYAGVQENHRRLLRDVFSRFHGREVDTQGDSFMVAFQSAHDAVHAAAEIQRRLAAEPWPEGAEVRVRIGIHTGQPERGSEGYVGIDVVRAARICSVAHGGQVVVSEATGEIVVGAGIETIDLGVYALKDFPGPERLFQLVGPGLERDFPVLRTPFATNLPATLTPLVGRDHELAAVAALLAGGETRVVTLTGTGGAGKSRLALEAARNALQEFRDGVYLVSLAPITDPDLVVAEIARVLGVRDSTARPRVETLADALRGRRILLVIDNFEHLSSAGNDLGLLMQRAPDLVVLATSRGRLRISGEQVVPVGPLPDDDATTLFLERASAADPTFREANADRAVVSQICARVDRLPLAIELAAARIPALGLDALLRRLDHALGVLTEGLRDAPARQRTLRATIDWSYGLLNPPQRALFASLAVFRGGSTLDAIETVCGQVSENLVGDLSELVDKGLLRRETVAGADPRFQMLATVQEYANELLSAETAADELRARHADFVAELCERAESGLEGDDQAAWLGVVELELDNVRAALEFAFHSGRSALGLRIVSSLGRFWRAHGHVTEARRWLKQGLSLAGDLPAGVHAFAVWTAARQAMAQHDYDAAAPLVREANALFRASGHDREVVFSLCELADIELIHDDVDRAGALADEAGTVAAALGDTRTISAVVQLQASVAEARGEYGRAQQLSTEALTLRRTLGDPLLVVDSAYNLGEAAFAAGDHAHAQEAIEECLALSRELGDTLHQAAALCVLGEVALLDGAVERAEILFRESLEIYAGLPDDRACAECLLGLAGVSAGIGRFDDAARLWGAADALRGDDALLTGELLLVALLEQRLSPGLGDRLAARREEGRRLDRGLVLRDPGAVVGSATPE